MSNASTQNPPVYVTMMDLSLKRDILCDTKTDGGGWVVIQRRTNGDVDFYRNWENYKNGFGSPPGDFWLGNEAVHNLTSSEPYELRIDLDVDGQNHFAVYSSFKIENEIDNYRLRLGSHSGTLEEESASSGFSYCNGLPFSTYDKDNDEWPRYSDAEYFHGAWWYMYKYNSYSNLNGKWDAQNDVQGLSWFTGHSNLYASKTEMKIRLLYK